MKFYWRIIFSGIVALSWAGGANAAKVMIKVADPDGPLLRAFITRPVHLAADRPVIFVMHGVNRNAEEYRDQWHDLANEYDFLLVVPEFSDRKFPGPERYNLGNVFDEDGKANDETAWSYSAIERIFDEIRRRFSMTTESYSLYGHSAGAQFVHRFIFHVPQARVRQIVSANAGWYMMPDDRVEYPYGLLDSAVGPDKVRAALQLPVTILLGEEDTDAEHPNLRRTPAAMAQGEHRLARGYTFFETAKTYSEQLDVPFNWRLATVPDADHDNRLMAPAAVPYLLGY
jgi:poly(3-hydroxybutyrate) depolymerase